MKKVLHADMHLSARSNDCWSARIHSAMDGLTQSYIFKQKLQICEPIDLSCFVIDLRERHLILKLIQENTTASALLITTVVLFLPEGRALVTHLPYILPKYMFLNLLVMSFAVQLVSDLLRVHTLRFETATWNQSKSPTCDLCDIDDVQDECSFPLRQSPRDLSPQEICISVSPSNRSSRCVYFLKPEQ